MLLLIPIILLFFSSVGAVFQIYYAKEFYNKMVTLFYFMSNFITLMLIYFLYSNKFAFIVQMIFPLTILNMVMVLLIIQNRLKDDEQW